MVWTALTRVFWIEKYAPVSDCLLLDFGGSYLPAMLLLICCSLFGLVSFLLFTWHDMIWWFTMGSDKRIDSCIRWTTQSLSSTGVFFSPNPRERGWWALFQNMTPYIKKRQRWTKGGAYYNYKKKTFFGVWRIIWYWPHSLPQSRQPQLLGCWPFPKCNHNHNHNHNSHNILKHGLAFLWEGEEHLFLNPTFFLLQVMSDVSAITSAFSKNAHKVNLLEKF